MVPQTTFRPCQGQRAPIRQAALTPVSPQHAQESSLELVSPGQPLGEQEASCAPWGYMEDTRTGADPEWVVGGRVGGGLPAPPINFISGCLLWALAAVPGQVRSCCTL